MAQQMEMVQLLEYQPIKTFYLVYFFGTLILVKIPIWFCSYLSPTHRPRRTWTIGRSLIVRSLQELFTIKIRLKPSNRDPSEEVSDSSLTDAKFVWLEPISEDSPLICGEIRRIADLTGAKPAKIAGYWFLKKGTKWIGPKAKLDETVVLHIHGGAFYVRFSFSSSRLLEANSTFVLLCIADWECASIPYYVEHQQRAAGALEHTRTDVFSRLPSGGIRA